VHLGTFVSTAEAAYHDKVTKETIASFLGALDGVAAMSYFMARDTQAKFSDDKSNSPNCSPYIDVDKRHREYMVKMDSLKQEFNTAPPYNAMKVRSIFVWPKAQKAHSVMYCLTVAITFIWCRRTDPA
jgi:hypothetical protein